MLDPSPALSLLPRQSPGFRLLLQSLVCGLGLHAHQPLLSFRILPPHRCSSGRAGSLSVLVTQGRVSSLANTSHDSSTPRCCRIKLKPHLAAARLSKCVCHSLREPSAACRHPNSSWCSLQIGLFLLDLRLSYFYIVSANYSWSWGK